MVREVARIGFDSVKSEFNRVADVVVGVGFTQQFVLHSAVCIKDRNNDAVVKIARRIVISAFQPIDRATHRDGSPKSFEILATCPARWAPDERLRSTSIDIIRTTAG